MGQFKPILGGSTKGFPHSVHEFRQPRSVQRSTAQLDSCRANSGWQQPASVPTRDTKGHVAHPRATRPPAGVPAIVPRNIQFSLTCERECEPCGRGLLLLSVERARDRELRPASSTRPTRMYARAIGEAYNTAPPRFAHEISSSSSRRAERPFPCNESSNTYPKRPALASHRAAPTLEVTALDPRPRRPVRWVICNTPITGATCAARCGRRSHRPMPLGPGEVPAPLIPSNRVHPVVTRPSPRGRTPDRLAPTPAASP